MHSAQAKIPTGAHAEPVRARSAQLAIRDPERATHRLHIHIRTRLPCKQGFEAWHQVSRLDALGYAHTSGSVGEAIGQCMDQLLLQSMCRLYRADRIGPPL